MSKDFDEYYDFISKLTNGNDKIFGNSETYAKSILFLKEKEAQNPGNMLTVIITCTLLMLHPPYFLKMGVTRKSGKKATRGAVEDRFWDFVPKLTEEEQAQVESENSALDTSRKASGLKDINFTSVKNIFFLAWQYLDTTDLPAKCCQELKSLFKGYKPSQLSDMHFDNWSRYCAAPAGEKTSWSEERQRIFIDSLNTFNKNSTFHKPLGEQLSIKFGEVRAVFGK